MAPVQGRPFLERLLDYWIGQGVRRAILAVGYMHETIRRHFGEQYRGCAITYSIEHEPLGTGGALVQALPLVEGKTFLALNGDTYFAVPLATLPEFHAAGHEVTVVDNFMYSQNSLAHVCANPNFRVVRGDIRIESVMKPLVREAQFIIPLAAYVGAPLCARDPVGARTVNHDAILTMLKLVEPM